MTSVSTTITVGLRPGASYRTEDLLTLRQLLEGEKAAATALYRELLDNDPKAPEIAENRLNNLGYQYLGQGRADDAVAALGLYAALYPGSANAHHSLGEQLMKRGRLEEVLASYRCSLELDPASTNARSMIESIRRTQTSG